MLDFTTRGLVLQKEYTGEFDAWIYLFTRDLGKVRAKATSVRKITSKLGAHLEPGLLVDVRLVSKHSDQAQVGSFQLADALSYGKIIGDFKFLDLVKDLTFDMVSDSELWDFLEKGSPDSDELFKISGFGGSEKKCAMCGNAAAAIIKKDQIFTCGFCSSVIPENLLTYI